MTVENIEDRPTRKIVFIKSLISERKYRDIRGKVEARYAVVFDNSETTLEQELVLTHDGDGWVASMNMDDFPAQRTVTASAWKLAEWMEKMAKAIKDNTFDGINLNSFSGFDDE